MVQCLPMEELMLDILDALRAESADHPFDDKALLAILAEHNRRASDSTPAGQPKPANRRYSKKKLLPFYMKVKANEPDRWAAWSIDDALEARLFSALRMKPRRTASGVATITVITKPRRCSSNCLYCPNDVRMPKSYLADEPACQRAERNFFDPYLQVASRLRALIQMGHATDKVELIVLGGTWSDYPESYQTWYISELFRALNEASDAQMAEESAAHRRAFYKELGLTSNADELAAQTAAVQARVDAEELTYNQAAGILYGEGTAWEAAGAMQTATEADLAREHEANESAAHRVVGLVVETRPDTMSARSLTLLRRLGCTKIQMGIQSLDEGILAANRRRIGADAIARAFALLRIFGFKIHAHFMANLLGATPESDLADYARLIEDPRFLPDEVKLYPCALVDGTGLVAHFRDGSWQPYGERELVDLLVRDTLATPPYMRISRMIRDISAGDIMAGNKKTNLRQMVEDAIRNAGEADRVQEIRFREISTASVDIDALSLETVPYETAVSREFFLQWVTPDGRIAGFCRLSLPKAEAVAALAAQAEAEGAGLPVQPGQAMIREVHVYGKVASLVHGDTTQGSASGAQHMGLGRQLVARACDIARAEGFESINVISAVGTRGYYRSLGFSDAGLYQNLPLQPQGQA